MTWWIEFAPEVISGVQSFGLPHPDQILESAQQFLSTRGEELAQDRWEKCPEKYFLYTHMLLANGNLHTLEFLIDDANKAVGVLKVAWVEHHPGGPFP